MNKDTSHDRRRICQPGTASDTVVLHAEFEALELPQTPDELAAFRRRLETDGQLSPLVVWHGRDMLVADYAAIRIYRERGIAFTVIEQEFSDREEVKFWILTRQLNRALSGLALCYLRGKRYLLMEKRQGQRMDLTSCQHGGKSTAEVLGKEVTTAERTIYRDARVAEAIDDICANCDDGMPAGKGPKVRDLILAGDSHVTRKRVLRLVEKPVAEQRALIERLRKHGRVPRSCREPDEPKMITLELKPKPIIQGLRKHLKAKELAEVLAGLAGTLQL